MATSPISADRVFLALPNLGWIKYELHLHVWHWYARHKIEIFGPNGERPVAYAKNLCIEKFLEGSCDYIWFIDSDTVPPLNALDLLLEAKVDVISGVVRQHVRDSDGVIRPLPMICRMVPGGLLTVRGGEGVEEIDACGAACLLIHRSVFDRVPGPPWFEQGSWGEKRGSDFNFCEQLREVDVPIYCHFGVYCTHHKEVGF